MNKTPVRTSLAYKVYAIVFISVFFCAVVIGISNYYDSKKMLGENIGEGLKKIAQTAVLGINADVLKNISSPEDFYYDEISDYLREVKRQNEIEPPIYILKRKAPNKASLILTTEPSFLLGAEYRMNPTMKKVFDTEESLSSPIYTDKSGTWISAYAPLRDSDGNTVGVLELNREVGFYILRLRFSLVRIIVLCIIGCIVGIVLGIPLLRPIMASIKTLSIATKEIEKGNYDREIRLKSSDEIGDLAYALEGMRVSIKKYIKQLKDAQDEIVRSEKLATIGKLTAGVSHELRTPLSLIRTSAYYLKTKLGPVLKDDAKVKKHLNTLESEVKVADRIIRDILTFGRIKKPCLSEVNINDAITSFLEKAAKPDNIAVTTKFAKDIPPVSADKGQLQQVFSNLILNAFQAMPKGGKLIIETSRKNDFIEINVTDTGEGISEENLGKIFDPLFSTKPQGTGLGLSICQSIVEGHKGTIEAKSPPAGRGERGTKFTIRLPKNGSA